MREEKKIRKRKLVKKKPVAVWVQDISNTILYYESTISNTLTNGGFSSTTDTGHRT